MFDLVWTAWTIGGAFGRSQHERQKGEGMGWFLFFYSGGGGPSEWWNR